MSDVSDRCVAITQSGNQCKLKAQAGSSYCHLHRAQEAGRAASKPATLPSAPLPAAPPPAAKPAALPVAYRPAVARSQSSIQLELLVSELNELAAELRRVTPEFKPPPFSAVRTQEFLKETVDRYTPDTQLQLLRDLLNNLKDTSASDLVDPETWKGLWYILNYSLQYQVSALRESLAARLVELPGMALAVDIRKNLEGTSPRELLDVDTWKGLWYVLTYTAQIQAQDAMRRILGDDTADE